MLALGCEAAPKNGSAAHFSASKLAHYRSVSVLEDQVGALPPSPERFQPA
ncbi:hypothetical protein [Pseudomonas sp. 35 E 8]|nr:hypothetical protein [Pseudomonas sp. 35 E 8]